MLAVTVCAFRAVLPLFTQPEFLLQNSCIAHFFPLLSFLNTLKGQLQGRAEIFKGLKMTFRTKILKKMYHVKQHQKYYKLCFDNFSLDAQRASLLATRGEQSLIGYPERRERR